MEASRMYLEKARVELHARTGTLPFNR